MFTIWRSNKFTNNVSSGALKTKQINFFTYKNKIHHHAFTIEGSDCSGKKMFAKL